jgi:hypothetical protein
MKITWTFYPKGQPTVVLGVIYVPKLDSRADRGYLEIESNTAYVNWDSFRIFDKGSLSEKKNLFGSLIRINKFDENFDKADAVPDYYRP